MEIDGVEYSYLCTYGIDDIDGVAGEPAGYESGDPVVFDEEITIGYMCWFDKSLPEYGVIRGIASSEIFHGHGLLFLTRSTFALDGSSTVPDADAQTCAAAEYHPCPAASR